MEFKKYSNDFAQLKNITKIHVHVFDKSPDPLIENDSIEFMQLDIDKKPAKPFFNCSNNEVFEVDITVQKDVFRINADIGYFCFKKYWGKES